jgi:hypothetical protein
VEGRTRETIAIETYPEDYVCELKLLVAARVGIPSYMIKYDWLLFLLSVTHSQVGVF